MKVMSVPQPWASLIVHGQERCRRWPWPTEHRGPLAIHASRRFQAAQRHVCAEPWMERRLFAAGIRHPVQLPLGCIVGVVAVVDCVRTAELPDATDHEPWGQFVWLFADAEPLAVPVPYARRLNIDELPADIARLVDPP